MNERPPLPVHPYRDSLLLNLFLAALILVISWLTGLTRAARSSSRSASS